MYRNEMAKAQREILGLTQKQLANETDIPACYISKYENGDEIKPEIVEAIHAALTSIRDRFYPENSYERQIYTLNLHCALFSKSETFNDKIEYCNKIIRDTTFLIQHILMEKKKADNMSRSSSWRRGYTWKG